MAREPNNNDMDETRGRRNGQNRARRLSRSQTVGRGCVQRTRHDVGRRNTARTTRKLHSEPDRARERAPAGRSEQRAERGVGDEHRRTARLGKMESAREKKLHGTRKKRSARRDKNSAWSGKLGRLHGAVAMAQQAGSAASWATTQVSREHDARHGQGGRKLGAAGNEPNAGIFVHGA